MNELQINRLSGPGKGQHLSYTTSPVSIGTAPGCDLKYDPSWDRTVSNRHAFIEWNGTQWMIRDAGSRDGTFINGRRIGEAVPVGSGAEIELGSGGPRVKVSVKGGAAAVPAPAAAAAAPAKFAKGAKTSTSVSPALIGGIILLVLFSVIGVMAWKSLAGDSDAQMAAIAKQYENCVGLVILSGMAEDGQPTTLPMATAWAVGDNVFATNSHVTTPVAEFLEQGHAAFIILNKNPELKFRVTKAVIHPKYDKPLPNVDGKDPAVPAYDVGLLYVEGKLPNKFRIASDAELEKLDSGYRVAYLGFPMEGIAGGGVDYHSPVATMQSGIVTANTDYWLAKAPFAERMLIAHSLGATGGSSGSPVFNVWGEVVGILSAGNIIGQVTVVEGKLRHSRAPSGVMINYAQRIDVLKSILSEQPADSSQYRYSTSGTNIRPDSFLGACILFICFLLVVICFAGMWKVFAKAGQPGWKALIPVYNFVVMLRLTGKPVWWVFLTFIPVASFIVLLLVLMALAKRFGKGDGFGLGLFFLPFIFYPILGFGDAEYLESSPS